MLADRAGWAAPLVAAAGLADEDIPAALQLAAQYGRQLPLPGGGQSAGRWAVLANVARQNLTVARVLEAHSDALAILAEAGQDAPDGTWGVFAAESAQHRLLAAPGPGPGQVLLTGVKPWCSLAGQLDSALVTAHAGQERQLFRVSLRHPSVTVDPPGAWVARGLRTVTSQPVRFDATPAAAVGGPGWYLTRPGFAWGAIGVAACWLGGARGLQDTLLRASAGREGELAALHAGIVDAALYAAEAALASAACDLDAGRADGRDGDLLALRVRAVIAEAAEQTIRQVGHALGPAPLAFDEEHARRVADLSIYLRQHHGERDIAALGRASAGERH
jgi:alkylation response protein AidB-like acyl-CoA dehydrogenase